MMSEAKVFDRIGEGIDQLEKSVRVGSDIGIVAISLSRIVGQGDRVIGAPDPHANLAEYLDVSLRQAEPSSAGWREESLGRPRCCSTPPVRSTCRMWDTRVVRRGRSSRWIWISSLTFATLRRRCWSDGIESKGAFLGVMFACGGDWRRTLNSSARWRWDHRRTVRHDAPNDVCPRGHLDLAHQIAIGGGIVAGHPLTAFMVEDPFSDHHPSPCPVAISHPHWSRSTVYARAARRKLGVLRWSQALRVNFVPDETRGGVRLLLGQCGLQGLESSTPFFASEVTR